MPSVATTASLGLLLVCSAATLIDGKSRSVEGNAPIAFPAPAEDKLKQSWKKAKEMGYMLLHADAYHYTRKDCYKPKDGDQIKVTYEGRLRKNGKVFDRSAKGKPYTLDVGANPVRVIRAWDWSVKELCFHEDRKVGEKATLLASSEWAYGAAGSAGNFESIGKNADLIFDLEIVDLIKGGAAPGVTSESSTNAAGDNIVKLGNKKKDSKARPGSPAAFFDAVLEEDIPLMEKLLAQYPEYLDITDDLGTARSALMDAAVNGKEDAAIWLIEKGCDITIGENSGYSPLDAAAYRGSTKLVAALLKAGLDPYRPGPRDGYLPMHRACFSHRTDGNHKDVVEAFHAAGFDMKAKALEQDEDENPYDSDFPGQTCREMAVSREQTAIVAFLDSLEPHQEL